MNLHSGLLFLHGHIADGGPFEDVTYASSSYGNKVANSRALREPWEREDELAGDQAEPGEARAA